MIYSFRDDFLCKQYMEYFSLYTYFIHLQNSNWRIQLGQDFKLSRFQDCQIFKNFRSSNLKNLRDF